MKIAGIIPSRYNSTRFPGKALALIGDKPMLAHICEAARSCPLLDEFYVATDSPKIKDFCIENGYPFIMTEKNHKTPTSRVHEAAEKLEADLYLMIGGDEPLLSAADIEAVAKKALVLSGTDDFLIVNAMTAITSETELRDPSNFKIVLNHNNECLYISRNPVPCKRSRNPTPYMKFVSIGAYTRAALDFFSKTPPDTLEKEENCDLIRFLEHQKRILFTNIVSRTLSVDTPADLEQAAYLLKTRRLL